MLHSRWPLQIAVVVVLLSSADAQETGLAVTRRGETAYAITVADDAAAPVRIAAAELATFLEQITGAEFAVVTPTGATQGGPTIAVGPGAARLVAPDLDLAKTGPTGLGDDGIVLKVVGQNLIITGAEGSKRGTLYAVYEFLERDCGVRWWTETASFVPRTPDLRVGQVDVRYKPPFDYREALFTRLANKSGGGAASRIRFLARQRFNGQSSHMPAEWGGSYSLLGWCHTFSQLLPPARYFEDHPDWYSETEGRRSRAQLCCTNDEMIAELTKRVLDRIRQDPAAGIISVSQNDGGGYCGCSHCAAMDQAEGSHAGSLVYCINRVAEAVEREFPGFWIETLAYLYTRQPPKTIRPRHNVLVRLALIERSAAQPIDSEMNRELMEDLLAWKEVAGNLFVWDYVANMPGPYTPHPTLFVYTPDLRTYAAHNVRGVFFEGNHAPGKALCDFEELKTYVISHAMWNPRMDENRIIDEFLRGYYGAAGPPLREYLELLAEKAMGVRVDSWSPGLDAAWLDLQAMNRATLLFDQADAVVSDDPVLRERVRLARLALDHQWLRGYRKYEDQAAATDSPFRGPEDPLAAVDDFLGRATSVAGDPIELWFSPDYGTSLRRRVELTLKPAPLPEALAHLPASRVVDVQDSDFSLFRGAELARDPVASDGWAARMDPRAANWSTQLRKPSSFGVTGRWHVYASLRCEKIRDAGPAFVGGTYDQSAGKSRGSLSVRVEDPAPNGTGEGSAGDGQYHLYDLGTHEFHDGAYIWFGTTGGVNAESVRAVYVDRVLFVKE